MNKLNHLNKLEKVQSNSAIKFLNNIAAPGSHCPLHTALALSSKIEGLSTLVVGTAECATYSRNVVEAGGSDLHYTYVLDDKEVVFGASKGLTNALKEMQNDGAKHIMIISTCIPEVIGEDIEGLIFEIEDMLEVQLSCVSLPHFKTNSYPSGTWSVLNALTKFVKKTKEPNKKIVNVLGWMEEDNIKQPEIIKILNNEGYTIRYIAPHMKLDDLIEASDATLNIVLSHLVGEFGYSLEKKHKIKNYFIYDKYSADQIKEVYQEICKELNIDNQYYIEEYNKVKELEDKVNIKNKEYVLESNGMVYPFAIVNYFQQLGAKPILIHLEDYLPHDKEYINYMLSEDINPYVAHMVNPLEDKKIIKEINPDFTIGPFNYEIEDIKHISSFDRLYNMNGYQRSIYVLNELLKGGL